MAIYTKLVTKEAKPRTHQPITKRQWGTHKIYQSTILTWQMLYKFKHLGEIKPSYFSTESDSQYHDMVSDVIQ